MEEKREIIYSDISSASRKQPYDAMVYLDGTSVIAVDSDGRKIATGTAGTDDATVIQAALDEQGTIYIASGTYYLNNSGEILSVSSDSHVYGSNNTKIRAYTTGIKLNGTKTDTTANITVAVSTASHEITVDDVSSFAVGDYILVNSNRVSSYLSQVYGEIRQIFSIAGNVITVEVPTDYYYELADTPIVTKLSMISNVTIEGIEIYSDDNASSGIGVSCTFSRNVALRGLKIHSIGEVGVGLSSCIDTIVDGCEIYDHYFHGEGYGVAVGNASRNIAIDNNSIYNIGNHCLTIGGNRQDGYPTHISHNNNFLTSDGFPIDSHFGGFVTYTNNFISGGRYGTTLMSLGADTVIVDACTFSNSTGSAVGPRSDSCMLRHVTISNCIFKNITGLRCVNFRNMLTLNTFSITGCQFENVDYAIYLRNIGTSETTGKMDFDSAIISSNTFINCSSQAIAVESTSEYTIKNVSITDNSIYSVGSTAIFTKCRDFVKISGNVVHTCGITNTDTSAISATHAAVAVISDNAVKNFGRRGLYVSTSGSTLIAGNIITGTALSTAANNSAIFVHNTPLGRVANNIITNSSGVAYNVYIQDTTGLTISNNNFQTGLPSSGIVDNTYFGNVGYVTENSGAAATVADGGTIAHGCVAAPTKVIATGSVAGEMVTITSIDATNITVAIKKPDNSAGTTQTVYWRAEV